MQRFFERHKVTIVWVIVISFLVGGVGLLTLNQAGVFDRSSNETTGKLEIAATVNGEQIPHESLQQATTNLANQYEQYYEQIGQNASSLFSGVSGQLFQLRIRTQALQGLIRQILLSQEANSRNVVVSDQDIETEYTTRYESILSQYNITEQQLGAALQEQGSTLEEFQQQQRTQVKIQLNNEALRKDVAGTIEPSDAKLASYFENNISKYQTQEQVRASHILVQDEETATDLIQRLEAGANFAELANQYSTDTTSAEKGGDLGWFARGKMVPEFEEVVFSLEVGEISAPVKTNYGYHIIRLDERRSAHTPILEEVRDQVRDDFIAEKTDERFNEWYEEIHAQATITTNLPVVEAYQTQQKDVEKGLSAFQKIAEEGTSSDEYLPYYIGRIYESKMTTVVEEKKALTEKEDLTAEEEDTLATLNRNISSYKQQAIDEYVRLLDNVETDESFLNRILSLDPENASALYQFGKLLAEKGDYFGADQRFQQAIQANPEYAAAYIASGDASVAAGNFLRAIQQYKDALTLRPEDTTTMAKLAQTYLAVDELDKASQQFEAIHEIDEDNLDTIVGQADLAYEHLVKAIAEQNTLREKDNLSESQQTRLEQLTENISDYYDSAVAGYERSLTRSASINLNIKLGNTHLALGELKKARQEFNDVIVLSPYKAEAFKGLGDVLAQQGDMATATEKYRTAFARSFDNALKEEVGEKIVNYSPGDTTMRFKLAELYAEQYKWSLAIDQYSAILSQKPDSLEAYKKIANAYSWRTEYDSAIDYLQQGTQFAENDTDRIYLYDKIVEYAQQQAGKHGILQPVALDALIELAIVHLEQGDKETTRENLDTLMQNDASYREDEVTQLLIEAGGEATTSDESAEGEAPDQTPSQTITSSPTTEQQTPSSTTNQQAAPGSDSTSSGNGS